MRLTIWALVCVLLLRADVVLQELVRSGMKQKSVVVAPGTFSESYAEQLARAELAKKPRVNFTQLYVYGQKGGAPLPKFPHITYEHWRTLYDSQVSAPNELAEMISIGSDAVLRVRDGGGNVSRRVLAGKDPLQIEVQGYRFEIVYLAFSAPAPSVLQRVDIYIRTPAPLGSGAGMDLLRVLRPIFPDLDVTVYVRNDAWFIYEPSYPFLNPLIENSSPPGPEQYNKTQTLRCGNWSGSTSCRLQ